MKSIMHLLINGNVFLFEDNDFTSGQKANLEMLAQSAFVEQPWLKEDAKKGLLNEKELCAWFVNETQERFGIKLEAVNVSFVARIK